MPRARTIAGNLAVLVGPSPATGAQGSSLTELWGLQSLDLNWSNPKEDVQIYGLYAPLTRETIESPEVSLNFSYLMSTLLNEDALGMDVYRGATSTSQAFASIIAGTEAEKNYFIFVAPDGADAVGLSGSSSGISIYGIGNGFINSYSIEAAVGGFPTASVSVQGLNIRTYTGGVSQANPAVDPTTGIEVGTGSAGANLFTVPTLINYYNTTGASVIKPGDITVNLANVGSVFHDYSAVCVQSFNISVDFNRNQQLCLGSKYAVSRDVTFPVPVNFEVEMLAKDVVTGTLTNVLCQTGLFNAFISMKAPSCTGGGVERVGITLKRLSLEGQAWNTSVGSEPQTVTTTFIGQIGGTGDVSNGMFMSGAAYGM